MTSLKTSPFTSETYRSKSPAAVFDVTPRALFLWEVRPNIDRRGAFIGALGDLGITLPVGALRLSQAAIKKAEPRAAQTSAAGRSSVLSAGTSSTDGQDPGTWIAPPRVTR